MMSVIKLSILCQTLRDRLSTHTSTIREKVQLLLLSEKLSSEDEIYHRVPLAESTSLVKRTMRLGLVPIFEKFVIQSQKDVLRLMSSLILLPSSEATGIKVKDVFFKRG